MHENFNQSVHNYVEIEIYVDDENGLTSPNIHFSYFVDSTLFDYTFILNCEIIIC